MKSVLFRLRTSLRQTRGGILLAKNDFRTGKPISMEFYSVGKTYEGLVNSGKLKNDVSQRWVLGGMDGLLFKLSAFNEEMKGYQVAMNAWLLERTLLRANLIKEEADKEAAQSSNGRYFDRWLSRLRKSGRRIFDQSDSSYWVQVVKREKALDDAMAPKPCLPDVPRGIFLHGPVGCGKTMLMDLLLKEVTAQRLVGRTLRLHFNSAMLDVHQRMHAVWRARQGSRLNPAGDTLETSGKDWRRRVEQDRMWRDQQRSVFEKVADSMVGISGEDAMDGGGATLLCFDEVQMEDAFTAEALAGLMTRLLQRGVVIVATSNRSVRDMAADCVHSDRAASFVRTVEAHCTPLLVQSSTDYRRLNAEEGGRWQGYFWPLSPDSASELDRCWLQMCAREGATAQPGSIPVSYGRVLAVPRQCGGLARFSFEELCSQPLGSADYVAIAESFHTVFVSGIPVMSVRIKDQARRFILLIDELYNRGRVLVCSAAASPDDLFLGTEEGPLLDLESLQFEASAEGASLRRNVLQAGGVAPLGSREGAMGTLERWLSGGQEAFAFGRAASRLVEMQSRRYTEAHTHSAVQAMTAAASCSARAGVHQQ